MSPPGRLQLAPLLLVVAGCGSTDFLPLESAETGANDDAAVPAADAGAGTSGGSAGAGTGSVGPAGAAAGATGASGVGGVPPVSDPFMPDPACMDRFPAPSAECARCVCSAQAQDAPGGGCLEPFLNCFENPDPTFAQLCGSLITCGIEARCVGAACYQPQLCMAQIDAAAMFAGGTLANCGMGEPSSNACRAANLLGSCINFNSMMIDGPCRSACM